MDNRRIRELRLRLDLSQERFARLLSVSSQTVRRWESGLTKPLPIISLKLEEIQREAAASGHGPGSVPMRETRDGGDKSVELGLGGLFKGIGSLIDLVTKMTEEDQEETARSGDIDAMGGRLRGVYGFSVRTGLRGRPVIKRFGNLHETDSGPVVADSREPLVDVFDEGAHLSVIAELPGIEKKDIHLDVEGDILEITASTGDRKYKKEVLLPSAIDLESMESSYRNGILVITLAKG